MNRRRPLSAAARLAAARLRQRLARAPRPCPYDNRALLDTPRPWLTTDRLLRILEPRPGERLLELGPGTGLYTFPVARAIGPDGSISAVDVQDEMLAELSRRAERLAIVNVETRRGDGQRLPFPDASFNGAFLVTVLGEIPDQDAALRELHRVLAPDARLVVGELSMLNPQFVRLASLIRRATAAGFHFDARLGPRLGYYTRFSPTAARQD